MSHCNTWERTADNSHIVLLSWFQIHYVPYLLWDTTDLHSLASHIHTSDRFQETSLKWHYHAFLSSTQGGLAYKTKNLHCTSLQCVSFNFDLSFWLSLIPRLLCKWPGNEAWTVDDLVSPTYVGGPLVWNRVQEKRGEEVAYCIGRKLIFRSKRKNEQT